MADSVNRLAVIGILKKTKGILVSLEKDGSITIAKGTTLESIMLPDECRNQILNSLARRYKIPIHYFWNPGMMD